MYNVLMGSLCETYLGNDVFFDLSTNLLTVTFTIISGPRQRVRTLGGRETL